MNTNLKKINILNVGISQLNIEQCIQSISDKIESSSKGYVTVTGAHGLIESSKSNYIKLIHNNSFLTIPDGMPLVWVSKLKGSKNISRCFGPEMMFQFFRKTTDSDIKHFFYGGNVGVADELKQAMELKFPKTKIVGTYCPPFRKLNNEEEQDLFERVKKTKPDIIWVGLSTPKQEIFMYEYLPKLDTKIMIGTHNGFKYLFFFNYRAFLREITRRMSIYCY